MKTKTDVAKGEYFSKFYLSMLITKPKSPSKQKPSPMW
ncbi:hypothetical protein AO382_0994 [Moraxella catarrhalis]|uniref:Uncharacterized protein n=1 Tax=Moraxella catarrhalis TaxID=480 RepID=A0A7Z1A426_MORCA|nr:hypothetical protein AO382_0994 [Moraxella catarrhalis]